MLIKVIPIFTLRLLSLSIAYQKQKSTSIKVIMRGRDKRLLLELFKYITENPEPAQVLLEKLKFSEQRKPKIVENLVF